MQTKNDEKKTGATTSPEELMENLSNIFDLRFSDSHQERLQKMFDCYAVNNMDEPEEREDVWFVYSQLREFLSKAALMYRQQN